MSTSISGEQFAHLVGEMCRCEQQRRISQLDPRWDWGSLLADIVASAAPDGPGWVVDGELLRLADVHRVHTASMVATMWATSAQRLAQTAIIAIASHLLARGVQASSLTLTGMAALTPPDIVATLRSLGVVIDQRTTPSDADTAPCGFVVTHDEAYAFAHARPLTSPADAPVITTDIHTGRHDHHADPATQPVGHRSGHSPADHHHTDSNRDRPPLRHHARNDPLVRPCPQGEPPSRL